MKKEKAEKVVQHLVQKYSARWEAWIIACAAFLAITQILFRIPAPLHILDAAWEAGDLISFAGTMALGFVAWQQNTRLLKVEEDTYVNSNSCMAHISKFKFLIDDDGMDIEPLQLQTLIDEHILDSKEQDFDSKTSCIKLQILLDIDESPVILARVLSLRLKLYRCYTTGKIENEYVIDVKNIVGSFSRVGISKSGVILVVTATTLENTIQDFQNGLILNSRDAKGYLDADIEIELISQKNVRTKLKCTAREMQTTAKDYNYNYGLGCIEPVSIWYGHERIDLKLLTLKNRAEFILARRNKNG